ncbi:MAG: 1,4-dihydroxy-2-naphthoate polyprenyltransferase [Bowdeniella nasicola]|nr:1,4-dihydroxy-2-naphthoate polyprenyltransferase [Bowdeniella nasicola]
MATAGDWLEGARPRTLLVSLAPVIVGTGAAAALGGAAALRAILAAVVALGLQVGANYANDYSDGVRGTDDIRSGPTRLTATGLASPQAVKMAAFANFALALLAGVWLIALAGTWWLLLIGATMPLAAWFYTGGTNPYGYRGLGEVFVFVFFGLVATAGTTYTQVLAVPWQVWWAATALGILACAVLMVANIRDIPTDEPAGKHTLAVRLGERGARITYALMLALAVIIAVVIMANPLAGWLPRWLCYLAAGGLTLWGARLTMPVLRGARATALIGSLKQTGIFELIFALILTAAL